MSDPTIKRGPNIDEVPALGYDPTTKHAILPFKIGDVTQDTTTGQWYGTLEINANPAPGSNQRVSSQSGDFDMGSIEDLATLLTLSGTPGDANTVNSFMGRLTKIRDLLLGTLTTRDASEYPVGATPLQNSSGNVANASAVATLDVTTGETAYLTGFDVTGSGATVGLPVTVTITGLIGGTRSYTYSAVAGALTENTPLIRTFHPAIPASATNTDIVVTCPALGTGNTNNVANIEGYKI